MYTCTKQMNAHTKVEWGLQSRAGWPSRQGCRPAGEGQSDRILHSFMTHREKITDSLANALANATQQPQYLLTVDYTCTYMHIYVCMCTFITGSPPDGHDRDVLGGSKLILAEEAILHVVQCVLMHSVGRTLPLQLEHQHPIVMP